MSYYPTTRGHLTSLRGVFLYLKINFNREGPQRRVTGLRARIVGGLLTHCENELQRIPSRYQLTLYLETQVSAVPVNPQTPLLKQEIPVESQNLQCWLSLNHKPNPRTISQSRWAMEDPPPNDHIGTLPEGFPR